VGAQDGHREGYYAFNDLHTVIALVGAGRIQPANEVLNAVTTAATDNPRLTAMMAASVGIASCSAMIAFGEQRYADATQHLLGIRTVANRFGGSNAQRDIRMQTLTEAAIRDKQFGLGSNLLNERAVHKPFSPLTRRCRGKFN
jgi:hypothetical protein